MYIKDAYEEFEDMLVKKHKEVIGLTVSRHQKLKLLLKNCPSYNKICNDRMSLDNFEQNCKAISELTKLKTALKIFLSETEYLLKSEKIFHVACVELKRLRKKVTDLFIFIKTCQRTLSRANEHPMKRERELDSLFDSIIKGS